MKIIPLQCRQAYICRCGVYEFCVPCRNEHREQTSAFFLRPFFSYSRAPQVQCQVAGAQSCSWYFIGILQLRETAALETMLQLPPLGRLGLILLNCSPKNTDLDSQVRCTFLCAAVLAQNGHKNPPEPALWAGESVLGVWSSQRLLLKF